MARVITSAPHPYLKHGCEKGRAVLSSCTFNPPLLVSLIVKESNIAYLLSRGLENHLSLSMYWSSSFHSNDSDSAIRFLGDFDCPEWLLAAHENKCLYCAMVDFDNGMHHNCEKDRTSILDCEHCRKKSKKIHLKKMNMMITL